MKIFSILAFGMMLFAGSSFVQSQAHAANAIAREDNSRFGWADVLRVDPVYDDAPAATSPSTQPCYEEQVPLRNAAPDDDSGKRTAGGVIGAIVGGILGHQIGKGDGRKIATAGGVVAGAVVGSNVAADSDRERADAPKYTIERRCPGADAAQRHIAAYDVEYRYRGDVYTSRLSYDPGDRIRVKVSVAPAD